MINPVTWFEIPVNDMQRAKKFYEKSFDIKMELTDFDKLQMAWFPFDKNGTGSTGTLIKGESYIPSYEGTMVYISVRDIESALKAIENAGGKILNPKTSIGEYGFVAHFEDSEGNRVALHSDQ
jgi:hypothetical protein